MFTYTKRKEKFDKLWKQDFNLLVVSIFSDKSTYADLSYIRLNWQVDGS